VKYCARPNLPQLNFEKFSVIGGARSGVAAAKLLRKNDFTVFLSETDKKRFAQNSNLVESLGIEYEVGAHSSRVLDSDCIIVSPGAPLSIPVLQEARGRGIPIIGEIELAFHFCQGRIIAITGSNGKSSATALLGHILQTAGVGHFVAGNIGLPFSSVAQEMRSEDIVALEVSSFQLETIDRFHPEAAIILNLSPDHLDRHGSYEQYIQAKMRILRNQNAADCAILNKDDQRLRLEIDSRFVLSEKIWFSTRELASQFAGALKIPGSHNLANAAAAVTAARRLNLQEDAIVEALQTFQGLEHRLEFVRRVRGVDYFNDSKATNVDALSAALQSFRRPIVLIAGGKNKGDDFSRLRELMQSKVKEIILLGETAASIAKQVALQDKSWRFLSLAEAVGKSRNLALPGDVVLFSPGCSSFDMFDNFEERGRQFKALVNNFAAK